MISLVDFLILIKNSVDYSKKDIDKGETPPLIYKICCCIRETFCLSYAIRKENNLYLFFKEELVLILLKGDELKYLGSDERSQALLFQKALAKKSKVNDFKNDHWLNSTPGFYIKIFNSKLSLINHFDSTEVKHFTFITGEDHQEFSKCGETLDFTSLSQLPKNLYILPLDFSLADVGEMMLLFKKLKRIKLINLSKISAIEDKILYINYQIDEYNSYLI